MSYAASSLQMTQAVRNSSSWAHQLSSYALFKRIVSAAEIQNEIPRTGITDLPGVLKQRYQADFWDPTDLECFLEKIKDHSMQLLLVAIALARQKL